MDEPDQTSTPFRRPASAINPDRGRPLDAELTARLVRCARTLIIDSGYDDLSMDVLAHRARCGKAAIYRRWPTKPHLAVAALGDRPVVPPAPDTGSSRSDLITHLAHLRAPLAGPELVVSALVGTARHDPDIGAGLHDRVLRPLRTALRTIGGRHGAAPLTTPVVLAVEALWWGRFVSAAPPLPGQADVTSLVDRVLLPTGS